jgi:hypothetical protein
MDRQRIEQLRAALDDELTTAVQLQAYLDEALTDLERTAAARLRAEQGDDHGHTPATRIEAAVRAYQEAGTWVILQQRQQAEALLTDMATAAELHHVTLNHLAKVADLGDLPAICLGVILERY